MYDFKNNSFPKMKQSSDYAQRVEELLIPGEGIVDSYKSVRNGIVFTDKRIIVVDVQGITGKKRDFTSIPYAKIVAYSVETAGALDSDAVLQIDVATIGRMRFEFKAKSKIIEISRHISQGVL
jgi:hypothetical protein